MSSRLFNIGNTHVLTAELDDNGTLSNFQTVETSGFMPEAFLTESMGVVSVVPFWEDYFRDKGAFILDWKSCAPVLSLAKMKTPETVGADRIANAISLISTGKIPALCIDCGTAITFEYVDSDRVLCGGAILPGRRLLRQALHDYTAKLPLVPFSREPLPIPGNNTVEAIQIGTDIGVIGAVREILEQFRNKVPELRVIFCGGDSPWFLPYFPEAEAFGSDFTLKGLALAFQCRNNNDRFSYSQLSV